LPGRIIKTNQSMHILLVAYLLTEVGVLHDKLYKLYCKSENIIGANSKILPLVYVFFFFECAAGVGFILI